MSDPAVTLREIADQLGIEERRTVRRDSAGLIIGFDVVKPDRGRLVQAAIDVVRALPPLPAGSLERVQVLDQLARIAGAIEGPPTGSLMPLSRNLELARDEAIEDGGYVWRDPEPAA